MEFHWENWKERIRPFYLRWCYFRFFPEGKAQLQGCWRFQSFPLLSANTRATSEALGEGELTPDIFFFPMTDWHARIQRTQHLASALSRCGHRCFYLSPHLGREFPGPPLPGKARRCVSILERRIAELHVGLTREPVCHHRLLHATENRALFEAWKELIDAFNVENAVQIVSLPVWTELALALRERFGFRIIYDCHDLLGGFERVATGIVREEGRLFDVADSVLFSSQWLANHCSDAHPGVAAKALLVRNGVNSAHFDRPLAEGKRSGKVVGYVGSLDHWLNLDILRVAAQRYPAWKFVLIGRIENECVRELQGFSNVELRGEVPYAEVPRHMAEFDVALIPFSVTPLTLATNPIKVYEYFSLGLPTVSTRLPELEYISDLLYLADNADEFATQIRRAAEEDSPGLRRRRKQFAQAESWSARSNSLSQFIRTLSAKP